MWLRCFECAWLRVRSPAHMCMWSLHLTSQVGTVTQWCSSNIQCSFRSRWILLERNKLSLKGYGCPKILLESTSNYSSYGNPCVLYVIDSMALLTRHCWSSFTSFTLATLTEWQHSALCWDSSCQNQSESNNIAWKPQGQPKWRVFWLSLISLSVIFRVSKGK